MRAKKTIEGLIEAENWRLGNNCIEGVKEDVKAQMCALGKLIDEEKEKLERINGKKVIAIKSQK